MTAIDRQPITASTLSSLAGRRVTRAGLVAFMAVMIAVIYAADFLAQFSAAGQNLITRLALAIPAANAGKIFAWLAVFIILSNSTSSEAARRGDLIAAFAVAITTIILKASANQMLFGAMLVLPVVYVFATSREDENLRAAAAILCALAINDYWGPLLLSFAANELLIADKFVLQTIMTSFSPHISFQDTVFNAPDSHSIVLIDRCSSFQNITFAILCWVTFTMLRRRHWLLADVLTCIAACVAMFALNSIRLAIMAQSYQQFEYWHNNDGARIFGILFTIVTLLICVAGAKFAERHQ